MVDDQISSLLALEDILSGIDARFIKATSAKEALLVLMKNTIDCVLLDVSMPEMDGFEFLQTLRSAPAHVKIPVIMVTGKIFSENETLKAYQYGAVDFLLKPLDRETVYRKVSFIVQQAQRIKSIEHIETHLNRLDKDLVQPLCTLTKDVENEAHRQTLSDIAQTAKDLHSAWKEISND
ncbi:MAG: two-component system response regulator [Granulosicoccus sp.]